MNGAEVLINTLIDEDVEYVFSLPGTCLMDIYDALGKQDKIKLIVVRHEQVATLMADGFSRISGKPAVALVSRGPASCNAAIGMYSAFGDSSPVVLIAGQVSDEIAHKEPFEIMDFETFFQPVTKWSYAIHHQDQVESQTRRALQIAQSGRPRPVVLGLPMQYSRMEIAAPIGPKNKAPDIHQPADKDLAEAIQLLKSAKKPVIIAGGGVTRSKATQELIKTAEMLGAAVVTTWLRKSVFPNDHKLYMGNLGPGGLPITIDTVKEADVVLAVGTRFSEFSTSRFTLLSNEQTLIHIDIDSMEMNKVFSSDVALVGDAFVTLQKVNDGFLTQSEAVHVDKQHVWAVNVAQYQQLSVIPEASGHENRITNRDVISIMNTDLPKETVIVIDAATFEPWISRYYTFTKENTFLGCAAGCMGFGFPAAMGAKLANPDQPVVLTAGDGSFAMVMQDLATAVRYNIGVVIIVTDNATYGNIRERQLNDYEGRLVGSELNNPDFGEVAKLFGAWAHTVESADQFRSSLQEALEVTQEGKPALINVKLDSKEGMPSGGKPPVAK